jgi:hypothetical protein
VVICLRGSPAPGLCSQNTKERIEDEDEDKPQSVFLPRLSTTDIGFSSVDDAVVTDANASPGVPARSCRTKEF